MKDLEASFKKNALRKKTPDPVFGKSKLQNEFSIIAQSKKFVPGVGAYKDVDKAYKSNIIWHKDRVPFIDKGKFSRFTETASKQKQWVPGPGSYDIIPYSKKEKR